MIFPPPKSTGLTIGLGIIVFTLALDAVLVALIRFAPLSFPTFIFVCLLVASVPVLAWVAYRGYGLARARYVLSRNALVVEWGGRREVIPMEMIEEARAGVQVESPLRPNGVIWPGCAVGRANVPDFGDVEFLAAAGQPGLVLVHYPGGWLAISPADPQNFLQAFAELRAEGVEDRVEPESARPGVEQWAVWRDRPALGLIALGGASVLLLVGYLLAIFPQLPPEIALHFNAQSQPDRFGPPTGLFILPVIAGLAWGLNTLGGLWLHRRENERAGAYLLFSVTVFVQALVWVAAVGLLTAGRAS
jgi:PH (Pleckstrin Homology) domain-containing protein/uncharacterized protein DUF1648